MINLKDLSDKIGKNAVVLHDNLQFLVTVKDIRISGSRVEYLVTPVSGHGETWAGYIHLV